MTREQLEKQNIERDGFTFTPRYTYEEICLEDETIDFDYTITATAEEVYQEWLEQKKPKEPKKTLEEQLEESNKRVVSVESLLAEVLKQQAKNTLLK
ncbi:MAG: hypothetical protein AB9856_03420 [Cellulosilyticaceae bacterium]